MTHGYIYVILISLFSCNRHSTSILLMLQPFPLMLGMWRDNKKRTIKNKALGTELPQWKTEAASSVKPTKSDVFAASISLFLLCL